MALMLGALNEALLAAGAGSDKARKAAEELAEYSTGHNRRLTKVESDLRLLTWMVAFNLAATIVVILLVLRLPTQ